MNNHKISDVTREKYEEAVVSVFMDQYAAALEAGIKEEIDACRGEAFPADLDKRCMELIQKEYAKKKRKALSKNLLRVCRNAAIIAVALLAVCSALFMSVEAFRIPVMNFFAEQNTRYLQLSGKENTDTIPEKFDVDDPLFGIIPGDFVLADTVGEWGDTCYIRAYSNEAGAMFSFEALTSDGNTRMDSEDAHVTPTKLLGYDAKIYLEGNKTQITWLNKKLSIIFTISATNVSEESVLICAETMAALFD